MVKEKALEREIKECLRWIDEQSREELSIEETQEPSIILKSFEEIEHMPLSEISIIRNEILHLLRRVD